MTPTSLPPWMWRLPRIYGGPVGLCARRHGAVAAASDVLEHAGERDPPHDLPATQPRRAERFPGQVEAVDIVHSASEAREIALSLSKAAQ